MIGLLCIGFDTLCKKNNAKFVAGGRNFSPRRPVCRSVRRPRPAAEVPKGRVYAGLELDYNKLLDMVSEMGYRLMESGAEIYRVEESIHRLLEAYGVPPDLVVGDFDSLGRRPSHPNVIQLPSAKDDTDMVYALREGLDRGFRRFVLLGGVGGRLEHTLANLQALSWLTTQGARGVLAGEGTVATVLRDETMTFPAGLTGFWSAFCLSGTAEGVTLRNLKFELTDHTISADFPLGVSNEFLELPAQVSVRRGALLAMWREQGDFYRLLPQLWNREPIQHEGE